MSQIDTNDIDKHGIMRWWQVKINLRSRRCLLHCAGRGLELRLAINNQVPTDFRQVYFEQKFPQVRRKLKSCDHTTLVVTAY